MQFHADLSELLRLMFSDSSDEILIVGDFNVHFETVDKPSPDLADLCAEYGLSQQVFEPTRISNHTLDLVFCNPCTLSVNTSVHPDLTSLSAVPGWHQSLTCQKHVGHTHIHQRLGFMQNFHVNGAQSQLCVP